MQPSAFEHDRTHITEEPEPPGCHHDPRHQDVDWLGSAHQGGGGVPEEYEWTTNPRHDRLLEHVGN
ncbi:MAG: hypothetical protein ACOZIN_17550 [Myxococcota bacterium]